MIFEGVKRVRISDNEGAVFVFLKLFIVVLGQFLKQSSFTNKALGITIALFQRTQYTEIHFQTIKYPSQSTRSVITTAVVGIVITDIPKHIHRF